jgi:hypothetical protein
LLNIGLHAQRRGLIFDHRSAAFAVAIIRPRPIQNLAWDERHHEVGNLVQDLGALCGNMARHCALLAAACAVFPAASMCSFGAGATR